ncbi:helix-turn-helix domain-containing protein [Amycolatopsis sp. NPDC004079]|uniref:helix-turn-helix domain-containing protein n=1 Tax=Amycolatopsis sp. NPDC004079 TaxID=3154549 RepID=UPI0033A21613
MGDQDLPESAAIVQAWLNHHMGASAPVIRARTDMSLFIDAETGRLEVCAVTEENRPDDAVARGCLWCLSAAGERRFFQSSPTESAVIVSRKPASVAVWSYERWRDGAREVATDDRSYAHHGPADDAPDVDPLRLRWLWSQAGVPDEEVARRLQAPPRVVAQRAFALGLPSRFKARQEGCDRLVLMELWTDTSLTKTEICRRLDLSPTSLTRLARGLELPERPKTPPKTPPKGPLRSPNRAGSAHPPGNSAALRAANERRMQAAAETMLERTRAALALPEDDVPAHLRDAGRLRLEHPRASLAGLAELAGCSKDTMAGRLRRLCQLPAQAQSV